MADTIVIPNCGMIKLLAWMVSKDAQDDIDLRLYVNNVSVTQSSVFSSFTEMTQHAYAKQALAKATWDTPTIVSTYAKTLYNAGTAVTFPFTGDGVSGSIPVYGYIATMKASPYTLLWVCTFEAAKPIQYTGETISVIPELRFSLAA